MPTPSSGLPFVLFAVGIVLTTGAWLTLMVVLRRYGLHSSWRAVDGLKRLFSEEGRADRKKALVCLVFLFGGLVPLFSGTLIADSRRNAPCVDACREQGYRGGRVRRSPHDVVNGRSRGPYRCWCHRGEQDWAPEPLDVAIPR